MNRPYVVPILILSVLLLATVGVILYGMGYRFGLTGGKPTFAETGLLVANSEPDGAQVKINGHLTTATNTTINLTPGEYDIEIDKDGYFPWKKKVKIEKEVVTKADALLFPTYPSLRAITSTGVIDPVLDPGHTRIAYTVASQSARKNGIYILDISSRPIITLQSGSTQIADEASGIDFSDSSLTWSPDGKQLLASVSAEEATTTYLLDPGSFTQAPQDVTETLGTIQASWNKIITDQTRVQLSPLRLPLRNLVNENFHILSWSPDNTKIVYAASSSATIPYVITPRLIGRNSTQETRTIEKGHIYVYDIKEDTNYALPMSQTVSNDEVFTDEPSWLRWFPDSRHLIYTHDTRIDVMEYDGQNQTTVYAGPFIDTHVFVAANDASRIIILTNLNNPTIPPNLYAISLDQR